MASSRGKRWNGKVASLPIEYLKGVQEKMLSYGDRVQFSLISGGPEPSYQILNAQNKTMAFDRNHHLLRPEGEEFTGVNATPVVPQTQIQALISGQRPASTTSSRTTRAASSDASGSKPTRTSAARIEGEIAERRYEYFKSNRHALPPTIVEHVDEITALMKQGRSAEDAFGEVVKRHF